VRKTKPKQPRPLPEVIIELRKVLNHTQQSFAVALGWSIGTCVRFEHGAQPSPRMLNELVHLAHAQGQHELAMDLQTHLNVALGPNFPLAETQVEERYFVLIARRIYQDPARHAAFLKFAAPEIERLRDENAIRKEHTEKLWAYLDTITEPKGGAK
jgi:hypothetical protein